MLSLFVPLFSLTLAKKQHLFEPILDEFDHPVPGLWKRGDKFYVGLNLRDSVGQSKQRRIPLFSQSVIQAKAELERLKAEKAFTKNQKAKNQSTLL